MSFDALATPLDGLNLIEASAGTGKTWTIAALYARLVLERQLLPEQILVVTYTKAATAELRGRIRARLAELALAFETGDSPDPFCAALLAQTEPAERYPASLRLRAAVSGFDVAAVFTIHGFCQRALGEHALLAGLELEREFVADETTLLQEAADAAWKNETTGASSSWLNWLIANGQSPDVWLAGLRGYLGHTDLRVAVPALAGLAELEQRFVTAHTALSQRWAQEGAAAEAWLLARSEAGQFKGTHRRDWLLGSLALWRQWLDNPALPAIAEDEKSPGQAESRVRRLFARELQAALKAPAELPAVFELFEPWAAAALPLAQAYDARLRRTLGRLVAELVERVHARKTALGIMSFHDLLVELDAALAQDDEAQLSRALRQRYHAALIDEFQDTDPLQFRIFDRLFGSGDAPAFLVGDPKQAIYAFRGAELHAYLAARQRVAPGRRYSLGTNRRSTPALVAALSQLFGRSEAPFLLPELGYPEVDALDDKPTLLLDGQVHAALAWDWLGNDSLGKADARNQAVALTADRIAALLTPGRASLGGQALGGGDIAVLASKHDELQAMQAALEARGIASVRISRQRVFETEEAQDLLQVLNALVNPSDRQVRSAMVTLSTGLDADGLYARLHNEARWEATLADFRRWQQLLHSRGAMAALTAWLIESGAAERIASWHDGERRLTNLLHLFELVELARRERPGLAPLLAWYRSNLAEASGEDDEQLMRLESDASRVRLVTIHAAKGLEYPVVFCPFLWDGQLFKQHERWALCYEDGSNVLDLGSPLFDQRRQRAREERLAEKLRLLYVALTRPRSACIITWGQVKEQASSALAWLLAGGQEQARDATALYAEIDALITSARPGAMAWLPQAQSATRHADTTLTATPPQVARMQRSLQWQWRMSSFSGLTAGLHDEAPDHDATVAPPEPAMADELGPYDSFPAGPRAGVCLHALFELWDYSRHDRPALEALAQRQLQAHGFDPQWAGMAADLVEATLHAPLTPAATCLAQVPASQRLVEMEFTYTLQPFAWPQLIAILADPAHGLPACFAEAAQRLHAEVGQGYLKGFIDLVCQLDGRHYVLDWKSNRLMGYDSARLQAAMADEHYYLQALIYCLALHRYLGWRQPGYDYERDFGGALYLFLRGITPAGRGVWHYRPPLALITALEALFCGVPA
ncbi:exodeoxyribonuclease V subunit beta [Chitinimonas sp. JJ19]|uniref:exodeoxyribonuclease V subunit beta n=1 Tax=Chitinimonas sp. JJ19 TaxID=3109352 RepID=UPI0030012C72